MKKILYRLIFSIFVFGGVFSFASAQSAPATNWSGTPYVWGNPVLNADGSVSAAMPNGWGSFGADPFDVWTGVNVDTGQTWYVNNRWLSDFGGRKIAQLLGLNVTIYNDPGTCPLQEIAAKTVTNIICGSNSGRELPPGSWRYYSIDPLGNNSAVVLESYADYFLMGKDDVAKYLFDNRYARSLSCYQYFDIPFKNGMTFDQMKQNVDNFNVSLCNSTYPYAPAPVVTNPGGGTTGGTGTGGTVNSGTSVGADTPVNLAKSLINSLFNQFNQSMNSISSIGLNLNTGVQTNTSTGTNANTGTNSSCYLFNSDLSLGSTGTAVTNLTIRLISEGLLTTQSSTYNQTVLNAVKAYQEKYTSQILTPVGLTSGTGYFGSSTRAHMNSKCTTTSTNTNTGTGTIIQPVSTSLVFEKPLSSAIPQYSNSCSLWTSPTGVTQQDSAFYKGSLLRSQSQGEYYRGFWYDKPEVTYVNNIATAPTPIYFGNIGFNPFEEKTGIATEDNLLLKKGDTWVITDQKISPVGHQKVLSLLGVSASAQSGEASDLQNIRTYNQASFYGNSYTWGYAQYYMRCEDELARFLFVNRNNSDVQRYFGYAYNPTSYNSPESFMSALNTVKGTSISVPLSSTGTTQTTTTTSTQTSTLSTQQIQDIQNQITVLLAQVSALQAQLSQLQ